MHLNQATTHQDLRLTRRLSNLTDPLCGVTQAPSKAPNILTPTQATPLQTNPTLLKGIVLRNGAPSHQLGAINTVG
jgi:hypothetical protein